MLLLSDMAVRRLTLDPHRLAERGRYVWARLRGLPVPEPRQEIAERLQMRRPPGTMGPTQARGGQRFEGGSMPPSGLPLGAETASAPPPAPTTPRSTAPSLGAAQPEPEADDYASRLLKAKKKALEERKKDEPR